MHAGGTPVRGGVAGFLNYWPHNENYEPRYENYEAMKITCLGKYPPFLPSEASKADVQRARCKGVTFVITPVSLPFLASSLPVFFDGSRWDLKREGNRRCAKM